MDSNKLYVIAMIILLIGVITIGVLPIDNYPKSNINDIHNCVVLKQHCGFDALGTNCYVVKDLKTGIIRTINVQPSECDIYHKNDTIK